MEEHVVIPAMHILRILLGVLLGVLLPVLVFSGCNAPTPSSLEEFRAEKDAAFRDPRTSPLTQSEIATFSGLHYFAEDSAYRVVARYEPLASADTFQMPTTHASDLRTAIRVGRLVFTVQNTACTLTAYRFASQEIPGFFVPFTDLTSGVETYGAGRYLDLEVRDSDARDYILDFNTAYNPYCAYNDAYSCPVVPEENALPVAILAGEKSWP